MGRVVAIVAYSGDRSPHPRSVQPEKLEDAYWTCIAANAATMRHVATTELDFVVCARSGPPPALADLLGSLGVRTRFVPFDHGQSEDFYHRYLGSLYLLDAIADASAWVQPDDVVIFVDPDVVWGASYDPLVADIRSGGVVGYELEVDVDLPLCHLTRLELADLIAELDGSDLGGQVPPYFGGEFYGLLGSELKVFAEEVEEVWKVTLDRYERGLVHFNSEEHVINAVMWQRGERSSRAKPYVQRIRTLPGVFGTRERMHDGLVAWHLPLEKEQGFPQLVRHLLAGRPLPAPGPAYHRWLRRRMGVEPVGMRRVVDAVRPLKWRLSGVTRDTTHSGV